MSPPAIICEFAPHTYKSVDEKVGADIRKALTSIALGKINARSVPEFQKSIKGKFPKDDAVNDDMLDWLAGVCAQHRVSGLSMTYLQIYLPWFVVMFAGLFADTTSRKVPRNKAISSLLLSVLLQVLFLAVLLSTLAIGDLSGTRDIQLVATMVAALVGALVQFVFPSSPDVRSEGDHTAAAA
jgi:hypothetical protein